MKSLTLLISSIVVGLLLTGTANGQAYAWHPKGTINKSVQNITAGGQVIDANSADASVDAKPGDTLKYVITVTNEGEATANDYNDMAKTVMTDTLPDGVEYASDPSKRTFTEEIGTLKPGHKITKEYIVKVTSTKNGDVIENKACFTGDSAANDNPQSGCEKAFVTVTVPPTTTPEPPKPEQPKPEVKPVAVLPQTGASSLVAPVGIAAALGYSLNLLRLKLQRKR